MNRKIITLMIASLFLVALASSVSAIIWDNPAYYPLDETSGNVTDVADGNDGNESRATRGVVGKVDNAFETNSSTNITIPITPDCNNTGGCSVSVWFNTSSTNSQQQIINDNGNNEMELWFNYSSNGKAMARAKDGDGVWEETYSPTTLNISQWYFATITWEGNSTTGNLSLYLDGNYENSTEVGEPRELGGSYGISSAANIYNFLGRIDEVGIWNRSLSSDEVSELYNNGSGLGYGGERVTINLNKPSDSSKQTRDIDFKSTLYPNDVNITNSTLKIWNSTDNLIYEDTDTYTNQNSIVNRNDTVLEGNFSVGNYYWNVKGCYENATSGEGIDCTYADSNYTFEWIPFSVTDESHNSPVLETSSEDFILNISTASGYSPSGAVLVYNSSDFTDSDITKISEQDYSILKNIFIPGGPEGFGSQNRSFYWNISIRNENTGEIIYIDTTKYYQNVTELEFGECGGSLTEKVLNFTMYDELKEKPINLSTNSSINWTNFQAFFKVGASPEKLLKNVSVDKKEVKSNSWAFCTASPNQTIYTDMKALYSAQTYVERTYYLHNSSLNSNDTDYIKIYTLPVEKAVKFFATVKKGLDAIDDAYVYINKYFAGEGIYKNLDIRKTDGTGEFTDYFDIDREYKFTIIKNGENLGTIEKYITCETAPCEIELKLEEAIVPTWQGYYDIYATNVAYTLNYSESDELVTYDFTDNTGDAQYFRLLVTQSNYTSKANVICNKTLYTTSGTILCNMTGYEGDFEARGFIARSPEKLVKTIKFVIEKISEILGDLGILISFLLIITIALIGFWNPAIGIAMTALAVFGMKILNFTKFSYTTVILIVVLALVTITKMKK